MAAIYRKCHNIVATTTRQFTATGHFSHHPAAPGTSFAWRSFSSRRSLPYSTIVFKRGNLQRHIQKNYVFSKAETANVSEMGTDTGTYDSGAHADEGVDEKKPSSRHENIQASDEKKEVDSDEAEKMSKRKTSKARADGASAKTSQRSRKSKASTSDDASADVEGKSEASSKKSSPEKKSGQLKRRAKKPKAEDGDEASSSNEKSTRRSKTKKPTNANGTLTPLPRLSYKKKLKGPVLSFAEKVHQGHCEASLMDEDKRIHPHLPLPDSWGAVFHHERGFLKTHRYFLSNRESVKRAIERLDLDVEKRNGSKTTVIEAFPGPGNFTQELLQHPGVEKVISMEEVNAFAVWLESLLDPQNPASTSADRLHVMRRSGFVWDTYQEMVEEGTLDHLQGRIKTGEGSTLDIRNSSETPLTHTDLSWQDESPLLFLAQLPNTVHGEQLFAQLVHAIATRMWLFKYGRVRMAFICPDTIAQRCLAMPGDNHRRAKLGATVQCLSDVRLLMSSSELSPYEEHFYPPTPLVGARVPLGQEIPNDNVSGVEGRKSLSMLLVEPRKHPLVERRDLDAFEFVTRNLFIIRTKPIKEALRHVAPGASNVLKMLSKDHPSMADRPDEVIDPDMRVIDLTNEQWAALARTFEKWPFRPDNLFELGRLTRRSSKNDQI